MPDNPLPTLNATLNAISLVLLIMGFMQIKRGNSERHKKFMLAACVAAVCFLISYLTYHYQVGSVPYPYHDWTRPLYFAILIPHVILAGILVPFIATLLLFAARGQFDRHKRLAKWVWSGWLFVSVSGVTIYLMLYHL